jgi:hypothetical protein
LGGVIKTRFNRARRLRDAVPAWVPALVDETPPSAARETPKKLGRSGTIGMKPGGA